MSDDAIARAAELGKKLADRAIQYGGWFIPTAEQIEQAVTDAFDPVNHPRHYGSHPSGIECIEVTRWMPFTTGNAVKYIWRADLKNGLEDMKKARWYLNDHLVNNRDPWIRHSTRDKLKEVAAADPSAVRARLFVLIAEGNLVDALTTLDSLIQAAEK